MISPALERLGALRSLTGVKYVVVVNEDGRIIYSTFPAEDERDKAASAAIKCTKNVKQSLNLFDPVCRMKADTRVFFILHARSCFLSMCTVLQSEPSLIRIKTAKQAYIIAHDAEFILACLCDGNVKV